MENKSMKAWLYLLPALAFLGVFMVYPLIDVFVYSFEEGYNSASQTFFGVGMYNYQYVLRDPYFLQALKNTFILVLITVPLSTGIALLISALLVAGRILLPYGSWSTSAYSADREKGNAVYEQTMGLPLIHGEDVGVPFEREEGESVYMYHEILPVGERWELRYTYGRKKHSFGLAGMESSTTNCFNESLAETFTEMLAHGQGLSRYTPWPEEGMSRIEIDWADEAWYGKIDSKEGEDISVLVLRAGEQVTRMIYPADLMSPENLESIRAEIMK